MNHSRETPPPLEAVANYPEPKVLSLLYSSRLKGENSRDRYSNVLLPTDGYAGELIKAYNLPNAYGIFAFRFTGAAGPYFVFNGSVAQEAQSFLGDHVKDLRNGYLSYHLSQEQSVQARPCLECASILDAWV